MIIVTNTAKITKGNGHKLIERFNKVGKVETMPGFFRSRSSFNTKYS